MIRKSSLILGLLCFTSPLSTFAGPFEDMDQKQISARFGYKSTSAKKKEYFAMLKEARKASKIAAGEKLGEKADFGMEDCTRSRGSPSTL